MRNDMKLDMNMETVNYDHVCASIIVLQMRLNMVFPLGIIGNIQFNLMTELKDPSRSWHLVVWTLKFWTFEETPTYENGNWSPKILGIVRKKHVINFLKENPREQRRQYLEVLHSDFNGPLKPFSPMYFLLPSLMFLEEDLGFLSIVKIEGF